MKDFSLILAVAIEFIGAIIIVAHALRAVILLVRSYSVNQAKLMVANGAITGLDFKLAATLLKTITLMEWRQIGMFAAIYGLRFLLKQAFKREQKYHDLRAGNQSITKGRELLLTI
jgi:uncharacterized membrane protein